jgi:hypothetical protein
MSTEELRQQLKAALLNRDFPQAQTLIEEWGKLVARSMQAAGSEAKRRQLLDEAVTLGQQSLYLARVVRANIVSELHANSASFLYADSSLEQPRWHLSA